MKKIFALLLSIICAINIASAQKIGYDKQEVDGYRHVITTVSPLAFEGFTDTKRWLFGYGAIVVDDSITYYLDFAHNGYTAINVNENCKMLLKFEDNTVIELSNIREVGTLDHNSSTSVIGRSVCTIKNTNPKYLITEEQIAMLNSKNLVKIRWEINSGYMDAEAKNIKSMKVRERSQRMFAILKERLSVSNTIYDNF